MKTILITGGNGMLAFAFKNLLQDNPDYEVIITDSTSFDITDESMVDEIFSHNKFDVLINCAAYTKVDQAEDEPAVAEKINAHAVGELAARCKQTNTLFVTFTTDYVFDGKNKDGYKEDDPTNPVNAYGKAKELGEKLVQEKGENYMIIRTQWLYGPNGKNFVDTIINAFKDGKPLKIVDDQWGSPTYTFDLAQETLNLIENFEEFGTGIYHVTNSGVTTWCRFARHFLKVYNNHKEVEVAAVSSDEFPRPAKRPVYSKLISTKTEELRSWEDAVEDYLTNA